MLMNFIANSSFLHWDLLAEWGTEIFGAFRNGKGDINYSTKNHAHDPLQLEIQPIKSQNQKAKPIRSVTFWPGYGRTHPASGSMHSMGSSTKQPTRNKIRTCINSGAVFTSSFKITLKKFLTTTLNLFGGSIGTKRVFRIPWTSSGSELSCCFDIFYNFHSEQEQ